MQFFEDRICGGRPLERLAVRVVGGDELIDALDELLDAGEGSATNGLVGDQREESYDLVQAGAVGRVESRASAAEEPPNLRQRSKGF